MAEVGISEVGTPKVGKFEVGTSEVSMALQLHLFGENLA
jgi:hypothetical protein